MSELGRTEDFPSFVQPFTVSGVDNVDHGMAVVIVSTPDAADAGLSSEVIELENCRRKSNLSR